MATYLWADGELKKILVSKLVQNCLADRMKIFSAAISAWCSRFFKFMAGESWSGNFPKHPKIRFFGTPGQKIDHRCFLRRFYAKIISTPPLNIMFAHSMTPFLRKISPGSPSYGRSKWPRESRIRPKWPKIPIFWPIFRQKSLPEPTGGEIIEKYFVRPPSTFCFAHFCQKNRPVTLNGVRDIPLLRNLVRAINQRLIGD